MAYMATMERVFIQKEGNRAREIKIIKDKIQKVKDLKNSMEDKFFNDQIDAETYNKANGRYKQEVTSLEKELKTKKENENGYMKYLNEALTLLENLEHHYEMASWEDKQKLLKILFPDRLIFTNGAFTNPSKEGINLLVEDIREFENGGDSGKTSINDLKALKKLGRVG